MTPGSGGSSFGVDRSEAVGVNALYLKDNIGCWGFSTTCSSQITTGPAAPTGGADYRLILLKRHMFSI